jgi:hypothetical protein
VVSQNTDENFNLTSRPLIFGGGTDRERIEDMSRYYRGMDFD